MQCANTCLAPQPCSNLWEMSNNKEGKCEKCDYKFSKLMMYMERYICMYTSEYGEFRPWYNTLQMHMSSLHLMIAASSTRTIHVNLWPLPDPLMQCRSRCISHVASFLLSHPHLHPILMHTAPAYQCEGTARSLREDVCHSRFTQEKQAEDKSGGEYPQPYLQWNSEWLRRKEGAWWGRGSYYSV